MGVIKAVSYRRVSTEMQAEEGYSLETQLQEIQKYARKNNLKIIKDVCDDSSGQILDRPGLTEARELLRTGKAGAIIAFDSDRISRNSFHYHILRDEWEALEVELHYVLRGKIDLKQFGTKIVESIQGEFAAEWLRKIKENTRRGKVGKVSSGKVIVAERPPFGYTLVEDGLIINEEEAATVRLIFHLYTVERRSIQGISRILTERDIPTPADKNPKIFKLNPRGFWSDRLVRRILKNETYIGNWHWGKTRNLYLTVNGKSVRRRVDAPREEWICVKVPPIIPESTFWTTQRLFGHNKRMAARNCKGEYLMGKRLTCGKCGCAVYAETRPTEENPYSYYRCASKTRGLVVDGIPRHNCGSPYFRVRDIDDTAWAFVKKVLQDPNSAIKLLNQEIERQTEGVKAKAEELEMIKGNVTRKEAALKKLLRKYAECETEEEETAFEDVRDELIEELAELRFKEQSLAEELGNIPNGAVVEEATRLFLEYQGKYYDNLTMEDEPIEIKKKFIEALNITGVIWIEDKTRKITISCNLGQFVLNVGEPLSRNTSYSLQISYTFELPKAPRKAPIELVLPE